MTVGVMSLWTRTPMFRAVRGPLLFATLAAHFAQRAFGVTRLCTDKRGAEIAEVLKWPFDEIDTGLEDIPCDGCDHVWALGKLVAALAQDRPFVQFDWDVLLLKPLPERITGARMAAQCVDFPEWYRGAEMRAWMERVGYRAELPAYNAGIFGGHDLGAIHAYAETGIALVRKLAWGAEGTKLSMFAEQYHAGAFAERHGIGVTPLLPLRPTREEVSAAGYVHMTGGNKRSPRWIARAEARMAKEFPEAWDRFQAGWAQVDTAAEGHERRQRRRDESHAGEF